jgi:hypothetical protein
MLEKERCYITSTALRLDAPEWLPGAFPGAGVPNAPYIPGQPPVGF